MDKMLRNIKIVMCAAALDIGLLGAPMIASGIGLVLSVINMLD